VICGARKHKSAEFTDRPTRDIRLGDRFPDERNYFQPGLHADEKFDITDDEIYRLREFNELEYLEISSRKLTDEGLRSLHGLRRLRRLALVALHVSPAGIAELRRQLPECRITFSADMEDRSIPTRGSEIRPSIPLGVVPAGEGRKDGRADIIILALVLSRRD
jgi:hypothetical protein